ncbi:MAG: bifunctional UDP-N-acetylglucosamine diphosphorylase/glucosamine-1-phosphate N-acetyltransferase GlmU [Veillonellaceae bacterium]|nr:bifunctional UDP-N-acetylglucosamine diphosphorylase/glucosamine-1-phosphate N-acetyltransferase GlmU [Veillonellaceae bacterium]
MSKWAAAVLAAGKGTRMKSRLPKVLHPVGGKPMVARVLATAKAAGVEETAVIIGFGGEEVRAALGDEYHYVVQAEQLGTGHAVRLAEDALREAETVLVICGDTPLLRTETIRQLYDAHREAGAAATILTTVMPDATGYGRIIRDDKGAVLRIVEEKDADASERAVREVNTGTYCFAGRQLWEKLAAITCDNAQGEYYLTDVIALLVAAGETVAAVVAEDSAETLGVNSRAQLAEAEAILRRRKVAELLAAGVTCIDPERVYADDEVTVGADTVLEPGVILRGRTHIGPNCRIGPDTELVDTVVGEDSRVHRTYAHEVTVGARAQIGPYVHLRPGTELAADVKVGNFVEVKNSRVGAGTKFPHLSYIGDSDVGGGVNVGCGTITVNYDGVHKHRTTIGDGAFVGCNTNLVAPVTVGADAYVGAGSTITKDVPPAALAVGRSRQIIKENWVKKTVERD